MRQTRFGFGGLVSIVLLAGFALVTRGEETAEQAAKAAATSWLALVDSGRYGESWQEAAQVFKDRVPKEKWEELVHSARSPLGQLVSRELKGLQFATELPGAPDGEYVVIQFSTVFEKKRSAVETITPMKDKDGHWRVSGYFIK